MLFLLNFLICEKNIIEDKNFEKYNFFSIILDLLTKNDRYKNELLNILDSIFTEINFNIVFNDLKFFLNILNFVKNEIFFYEKDFVFLVYYFKVIESFFIIGEDIKNHFDNDLIFVCIFEDNKFVEFFYHLLSCNDLVLRQVLEDNNIYFDGFKDFNLLIIYIFFF